MRALFPFTAVRHPLTGRSDDLDSLASFSTFGSHTTLSSLVGTPVVGQHPYGAVYTSSLAPPAIRPIRPRTGSSVSATFSSFSSMGGSPTPGARVPSPTLSTRLEREVRERNASNNHGNHVSPSPVPVTDGAAAPVATAPGSAGASARGTNGPDRARDASAKGSGRDRFASPQPSHSPGGQLLDADAKRRRRARNEERWLRVRAREAAHDAPVRRWARAAHARIGPRPALWSAVGIALVVRVLLGVLALYWSSDVQRRFVAQVAAARATCAAPASLPPILRPLARPCRTVLAPTSSGSQVRAFAAVLAFHLALETVLWSAALGWALIEGRHQRRTMRTRIGAVIYLVGTPVLALADASLLPTRTPALGLTAWSLLLLNSGYDGAAAALIAAAVWVSPTGTPSTAVACVPGFIVYALGKRIWLADRGRGYLARLAVAAALALAALEVLRPAPLRARVGAVLAVAKNPRLLVDVVDVRHLISLRGALTFVSLIPVVYLTFRASIGLRPRNGEAVPAVPATVRLLPLTLAATAAAAAFPAPAAPLLPLALTSALRGDDDEWAVAIQAHHVAALALWPRLGPLVPLAGAYVLAWGWLIGAKRDAPDPILRAHQLITTNLARLALLYPLLSFVPSIPLRIPAAASAAATRVAAAAGWAHTAFVAASIVLLVVWANVRLVKTAWAIGAL